MNEATQRSDLGRLAAHLARRRDAIVARWCDLVRHDPQLAAAARLPRSQFEDHVPQLLQDFEHCLRTHLDTDARQQSDAAEHGEQRWRSGYDLADVTREWGHLHLVLVDELNAFERDNPEVSTAGMAAARRSLASFVNEGICASNAQYVDLQKSEAGGQLRDVARTLDDVRRLEQERAEILRQAAHDLRGNMGVISNATAALAIADLSQAKRETFVDLLRRSVSSLQSMLDDVMDLARLQAGHEAREIKAFDAASLVRDTCAGFEFMARERGLALIVHAAGSLPVEGDPTKTRRIAQNLVLNALRYTVHGHVTVECSAGTGEEASRWVLRVQDTGPGLSAEHAGGATNRGNAVPLPAGGESDGGLPLERGEGVGLSIVKRLCELLEAAISIDTAPGVGTAFRVSFPRSYEARGGRD